MSRQYRPFSTSLKVIAGAAACAMLIGWAAGVGAQTPGDPTPPPLPPAVQGDAAQTDTQQQQPPQQAAAAPANNATGNSANGLPPLPLGRGGVREVQSQLIALGFNPGAPDGVAGPATRAAAQKFNESRGYDGPVPIDAWLLTRLQQDTGPRLTPEQVAARSQPRRPAPSNTLANGIQRFGAKLRALFNGGS